MFDTSTNNILMKKIVNSISFDVRKNKQKQKKIANNECWRINDVIFKFNVNKKLFVQKFDKFRNYLRRCQRSRTTYKQVLDRWGNVNYGKFPRFIIPFPFCAMLRSVGTFWSREKNQ